MTTERLLPKIILALDVDGVVNAFTKNSRKLESGQIAEWPIKWRPPMIERLKAVLALPNVEGAWLTTWLQSPALLDELEELLGLKGYVPHRAEYPFMVELGWGGAKVLADERFTGSSLNVGNPRWWKFRSAQFLVEDLKPDRFAWIDDELGSAKGIPNDIWKPVNSYDKLLMRTHSIAALLPEDLDKIEAWVAAPPPDNLGINHG